VKALGAALRQRVTALGVALRELGLPVGIDAQSLALSALSDVGLADGEDVRLSLRAVYARSRSAQHVFDEIYPRWLRGERLKPEPEPQSPGGDGPQAETDDVAATSRLAQRGAEGGGEERGPLPSSRYSPAAAKGQGGEADPGQEGMADAMRDAAIFLSALRSGEGRRRRPGRRGDVDLRRSLRAAHATAGEVLLLRRRRRRPRPPRVVLLCDFSRSMSGDADVLLRMAHALVQRSSRTEVFAFSTEIRRITANLRRRQGLRALQDLGFAYGGGTRIGLALDRFVRGWGARLLGADSVVLIVSDGLDTGETILLRDTMAAIRAAARSVFWLSPLAGTPGYQPVQGGVRAALPYCDAFGDALDPFALTRLVHPPRQGGSPS